MEGAEGELKGGGGGGGAGLERGLYIFLDMDGYLYICVRAAVEGKDFGTWHIWGVDTVKY